MENAKAKENGAFYAKVKATGEIVEVEFEKYALEDGVPQTYCRETGTNRGFDLDEIQVATEDEVNLFLLCPDVYMDNLKNGGYEN